MNDQQAFTKSIFMAFGDRGKDNLSVMSSPQNRDMYRFNIQIVTACFLNPFDPATMSNHTVFLTKEKVVSLIQSLENSLIEDGLDSDIQFPPIET